MNDGLKDQQRNAMLGVLKQHPKIERAVLFGSRAMGTFTPTSDIDVALYGDLTLRDQAKIADELEQLPIPFTVDLVRMKTVTSPELLAHIKEHGKKLELGGGSEWEELTLGDFVTLQRGHDLTDPQRRPGGVPVMGSAGQNGFHDTARSIGPGIVIGRSGASFGQVHFSNDDYWPHNTALYVTDFKGNDPKFAFYFLKAIDFSRYNSGSAQPSLNRNFIYPIPVRIPPLPEQKRIAHILGTLDDKIELNRRMNATLEAMARALFQSWFVDFDPVRRNAEGGDARPEDALFPDALEDSDMGQIPKGWKVGTIHDCCLKIQNGGTPRRNELRFWEGGNIPWLASGEVRQSIITATESFITEEGLAESSAKKVPAFSTVVALYGATAGQVSFTSFCLTTNQAVCALIPKKGFSFFNYLMLRGATAELENKAVGSAQQNISKGIVEEVQVVLPPTALVEQFADEASPLFERWISNLHQSRTLAALRNTLLPSLLSGNLPVTK